MSLTRDTLVQLHQVADVRVWRITGLGYVLALPRSLSEETKRVEVRILVEGAIAEDLRSEIVRRAREAVAPLEIELLTYQEVSAAEVPVPPPLTR